MEKPNNDEWCDETHEIVEEIWIEIRDEEDKLICNNLVCSTCKKPVWKDPDLF